MKCEQSDEAGANSVRRSRCSIELGNVKNDPAAVALRAEEPGKAMQATEFHLCKPLCDVAEGACLDLHRYLPRLARYRHLRLVLQAQIEGRNAGRCVPQRASFQQLRLKNQAIHRAG